MPKSPTKKLSAAAKASASKSRKAPSLESLIEEERKKLVGDITIQDEDKLIEIASARLEALEKDPELVEPLGKEFVSDLEKHSPAWKRYIELFNINIVLGKTKGLK